MGPFAGVSVLVLVLLSGAYFNYAGRTLRAVSRKSVVKEGRDIENTGVSLKLYNDTTEALVHRVENNEPLVDQAAINIDLSSHDLSTPTSGIKE